MGIDKGLAMDMDTNTDMDADMDTDAPQTHMDMEMKNIIKCRQKSVAAILELLPRYVVRLVGGFVN
jgi:hypothetical protein